MKGSDFNVPSSSPSLNGHQVLSVACLCAAWCGVCRQYESEFLQLQSAYPQVRFVWVDVEESEEVLGDVDVETFPTLLIGHAKQPLFFGPLLPQIKVLERLVQSLAEHTGSYSAQPEEVVALWQRLSQQWQ